MIVLAAAAFAAGCTDSGSRSGLRGAPATVSTTVPVGPTTTVAASPRTVVTISSELGPGEARIGGTVTGPEGPIPGAMVRVERLVGDDAAPTAAATTTVESGADGRWGVESVNGGRYRLRAWRPPDLAQVTAVVAFVTIGESPPVDLVMTRHSAEGRATTAVSPDPPVVGQPAIVVVSVASGGVDSEGVVRTQARQGVSVTLGVSPNVGVTTPTIADTDAAGNAGFGIVCTQPGPIVALVTVASVGQPAALPPCVVR